MSTTAEGIQKWTVEEPYLDIRGGVLEGPYYSPASNQLRFVDLDHDKVYFVDLAKGPKSLRVVATESPVGVTTDVDDASTHGDRILVAAKHGFATLDRQTGALSYVCRAYTTPADSLRMRFNDGAVDSHGRFWAGSCNDHRMLTARPEGTLFRLDADLSLHRMAEGLTCANGIGWSPADDTMYLVDSPAGKIFAFDYDAAGGGIANRRDFFTLDVATEGSPDGLVVDVEGCIWLAVWCGSRVLRISPRGDVVGAVVLPTRFVTCPEFVGTELFITTALEKEPDKYPDSARYGGKVYRVDVGVQGRPRTEFRWT